jgi:prefoldin subunit 5
VLQIRSLSSVDRSVAGRATLLALLLLVAIPAAAQGRTFKVDGRVTGPPAAKGGAVTVPLKATPPVGRALNVGTRDIGIRLPRRAKLRLSGPGASGASRLSPSGLRTGDRVKGVTSLSRRARLRVRWHYRPTLKLKRATVIRPAPRGSAPRRALGVPAATIPLPPFSGIPGLSASPLTQVVAHLAAQSSSLSARGDDLGPLAQKIEAQGLQLEALTTGLKDVTTALVSLGTALQGLEGVDPAALDALLDQVEALRLRVEALENGIGSIDSTLGELDGAQGKVKGAAEKLAATVATLAGQVAVIQQTAGGQAQVALLDSAATSLNGRLDAIEAGLNSLASGGAALIVGMNSLAGTVNTLTAAAEPGADFATLSAGVDELVPAVAALESGFGGLAATSNALVPVADAIETEAPALESAVGELCSLVPTTCP